MTVLDYTPEMAAGTARPPTQRLVVVVGYDGSAPARHALDHAAELMQSRDGMLEVVFVSRLPASTSLSPQAVGEVMQGLDQQAASLAEEVRSRLAGGQQHWHFQHRDGSVATELLAVAADMKRQYGNTADIAIAVGGPAHRYHHVVGSVGASLVHTDRFAVIVVP